MASKKKKKPAKKAAKTTPKKTAAKKKPTKQKLTKKKKASSSSNSASRVKGAPPGFGRVTPVFTATGCADAIAFYVRVFGVKENYRTAGPDGAVMHAELSYDGSLILCSEAMMGPARPASFHVYVADCDAVFDKAVAAGCTVELPMADQFWGDRYGFVVDAWGNRWGIATQQRAPSSEEVMAGMKEAFANMPPPSA
jgi:uncharacterized glyoxalase superfamily protein PhnB